MLMLALIAIGFHYTVLTNSKEGDEVDALPSWYKLVYKRCHQANDIWYNPANKICCGARVLARTDTSIHCCHGSDKLYSSTTEFCCAGRVFKRTTFGSTLICCGNTVENQEAGRCCHNNWLTYTHELLPADRSRMQCCGTRHLFDMLNERCCYEENVVTTFSIIPRSLTCPDITSVIRHHNCSGKVYDPDNTECCNGILLKANDVCCTGQVSHAYKRDKNRVCCSSDHIDVRTHVCCDGESYHSASGLCCRNKWVAFSLQQRATRDQHICCGGLIIDAKKHKCCNEKIQKKGESECCGTRPIKEHELCCDGAYIINRHSKKNTKCCISVYRDRYIPYDVTIEVCTSLGLISRGRPEYIQTCGSDVGQYNVRVDTCCGGILTEGLPQADAKCCRGTAYNKMDLTPCDQIFCAGSFYSADHICCGDHVYLRGDHGDQCCGDEAYKLSDKHCCRGVLQTKKCRYVCSGFCRKRNMKDWKLYVCRHTHTFKGKVVSVRQKRQKIVLKIRSISDVYRRHFPRHINTTATDINVYFKGHCKKCRANLLNKEVIVVTNMTQNTRLHLTYKDMLSVIPNKKIISRIRNYRPSKCNIVS